MNDNKTQKQIAIENGLAIGVQVELCAGTCDARMATVVAISETGFTYSGNSSETPFFFWY